jgi:lycopene beta-cyclase
LKSEYNYIIAGAGCAGLSLVMHMIHSGKFSNKKILIIDRDLKRSNDRTWCFWKTEPTLFEDVIYKKWNRLWFHGENFSEELDISPYQYHMIRGIDFYQYSLDIIRQQKNITIWNDEVTHVFSTSKATGVIINGKAILAEYVFNSILFTQPSLKKNQYWLLQHFKGWVIETDDPVFDTEKATLMDFRISQEHGTAFCYVLPTSPTKALIEYTLFTPSLLEKEEYDLGLKDYVENIIGLKQYRVTEEEFGVIPMTNFKFSTGKKGLINIGTAGGQTKGSSGYTFNFIQKHSASIVAMLLKGKRPVAGKVVDRFGFYDSVLLHILYHNKLPGKLIFTELFRKNPAPGVLKFLDNETSIGEELKIISTLPTLPFMKAAMKVI